jgi:N-acetylglucosaminyl-diphospho-decaprenol L-rhamnosyltransferase
MRTLANRGRRTRRVYRDRVSAEPLPGPAPAAVVVVNYGSHELLDRHLRAFDAEAAGMRVVVVDNRSDDDELRAVRALGESAGWDVVALESNAGFGEGANAGVRRARELGCGVVVLLNPDAVLTPSTARALVEACIADPDALIGPRVIREDGTDWFRGGRILVGEGRTAMAAADDPRPHPWLTGACLAVSLDLWDRLGGFADEYFMYWEDVDLSYRCERAGGHLIVRSELTVTHFVGGTQQSAGRARSSLYYRYNCRNRLLFAARNLPPEDIETWLGTTFSYAKMVVLRGGRRQFLRTPLRPLRAALRGSLEGRRIARRALAQARGGATT